MNHGVDLRIHRARAQARLDRNTSPRTTRTFEKSPDRASSLCGTQSRTRHTTSAFASTRRFTSQLPTVGPVPPVTNFDRSIRKMLAHEKDPHPRGF